MEQLCPLVRRVSDCESVKRELSRQFGPGSRRGSSINLAAMVTANGGVHHNNNNVLVGQDTKSGCVNINSYFAKKLQVQTLSILGRATCWLFTCSRWFCRCNHFASSGRGFCLWRERLLSCALWAQEPSEIGQRQYSRFGQIWSTKRYIFKIEIPDIAK